MRLHLRGKSHRHAPAKMGAGSSPCANTLNESGKAHARGACIGMDWNTCGVVELIARHRNALQRWGLFLTLRGFTRYS